MARHSFTRWRTPSRAERPARIHEQAATGSVFRMTATALRTGYCGALTSADIGRAVRLGVWVHRVRDLGGLVFADLRDREGLVQLSFDHRWTPPDVMARAAALGAESVVLVEGTVDRRPEPARDAGLRSREV